MAHLLPKSEFMICWSCKGPADRDAMFCKTCNAIQPPGITDHFVRLELEHKFDLDLEQLARKYIERQLMLHPDKFMAKSSEERRIAEQQTAATNDAYETLKDPLRRAEYMAKLAGIEVGDEDGQTIDDAELLMEAMEQRQALMEATSGEMINLKKQTESNIKRTVDILSELFKEHDWIQIPNQIIRLKYQRKFMDEIRNKQIRLN